MSDQVAISTELKAMESVASAIAGLDNHSAERVLQWAAARFLGGKVTYE